MLKIGFVVPDRLIPTSLDPLTQSSDIAGRYHQIMTDQSEIWYGGTFQGAHSFSLEISTLSTNPAETVRLRFPIHLIVSKTQEPAEKLNIISQMGGGGDGTASRTFSDIELRDGEWDIVPEELNSYDLRVGEFSSMPYIFNTVCQQAGIYKLEFSIPYTLLDGVGTETPASTYYIVSLACPQSATLWFWNGEPKGQLEKFGSFIFQDGQYIPQP
jgi:hypothetical protein